MMDRWSTKNKFIKCWWNGKLCDCTLQDNCVTRKYPKTKMKTLKDKYKDYQIKRGLYDKILPSDIVLDFAREVLRDSEKEKMRVARAAFAFNRRNDLNDDELEIEFEKWLSRRIKTPLD